MVNLKEETAKRLSALGISENVTFTLFSTGLIDDRTAKKYLVREEYEKGCPGAGHKVALKEALADKFCVSIETIKGYIRNG